MPAKKTGGLGETLRTIIYAVIIAFGVRTFLYEPFNIPSGSMMPTLLEGDYLFVSKFSYGYSRYTVAFGTPLFDGRIPAGGPERGDVVVFRLPTDTSIDYIKRVIGLPGDTIQMKEGRLYINGDMVERRQVEDYTYTVGSSVVRRLHYIETLPGGVEHDVLERNDNWGLDNTQAYVVPPGHYFMMGDNRDDSQDSRVMNEVGYVPEENLVGRAEFLWFSLDDGTRFWQVWKWPVSIRLGRMFRGIH